MPGEKFYSFAISTRGLDEVRLLSGAPKIKSKFVDYEFVQNDHIILLSNCKFVFERCIGRC